MKESARWRLAVGLLLGHLLGSASGQYSYLAQRVPAMAGYLGYNKQLDKESRLPVVAPYEGWAPGEAPVAANVIEHRRWVEAVSSRCWASTVMEEPRELEPDFVVISPSAEIRLPATAPAEAIRAAGFQPQLHTTILVHGFTQSYPNTTWLRRTRALFEMHQLVGRRNLIIMDWARGAQGSYASVAANVGGMGSFLANFLLKLINELGTERMQIHIIGHSLGAHVSGFAGKRIRPRLGRITALDPAGPCFGKFFMNSPTDRLSPDDAFEVDVYHYDDNFLGLPGQHGQFDVYVNGGSSQPGCTDNMNSMLQAAVTMLFRRNRVLSESHTRSTEVACADLAPTGCQLVAYECQDYSSFLSGECAKCDQLNRQCFLVSFAHQLQPGATGLATRDNPFNLRTSFPGKRLYLSTGDQGIYCNHHYQILLKFEPNPDLAKRQKWLHKLELLNEADQLVSVAVTNQLAPNVFSYLLLVDGRLPASRIRFARLLAQQADGKPVAVHAAASKEPKLLKVFAIELNFMSNIDPNIRQSLSTRLCPAPQAAVHFRRQPLETNMISGADESLSIAFAECPQ